MPLILDDLGRLEGEVNTRARKCLLSQARIATGACPGVIRNAPDSVTNLAQGSSVTLSPPPEGLGVKSLPAWSGVRALVTAASIGPVAVPALRTLRAGPPSESGRERSQVRVSSYRSAGCQRRRQAPTPSSNAC